MTWNTCNKKPPFPAMRTSTEAAPGINTLSFMPSLTVCTCSPFCQSQKQKLSSDF